MSSNDLKQMITDLETSVMKIDEQLQSIMGDVEEINIDGKHYAWTITKIA